MSKRGESAEFALSQHQVEQVLAACLDLEDRLIIGLALFCGLRVSEIAHLRTDWITSEGNLRVPSQIVCSCAECARLRNGIWTPKTKAGARTLPIPQRLRKDLAELFKVKPYGLGISRVGLYYRTKTILKRARIRFKGLSGNTVFPHALRSTCFNMLAQGGMSAVNLCAFAGLKSIAIGSNLTPMAPAKKGAIEQGHAIFG